MPHAPAAVCMRAGLIERPGFFEKGFALRRDRDRPIEMRQRIIEISAARAIRAASNCAAALSGRLARLASMWRALLQFALGKQHRRQQMMQHGSPGRGAGLVRKACAPRQAGRH